MVIILTYPCMSTAKNVISAPFNLLGHGMLSLCVNMPLRLLERWIARLVALYVFQPAQKSPSGCTFHNAVSSYVSIE
jgi:hypothetical protein